MSKIKNTLIILAGLLLISSLSLAAWNFSAPSSLRGTPDQAVDYINHHSESGNLPYRNFYFDYQSNYLHVVEGGINKKGTILFLHGFPSFWYSFSRQMEAFKSQYRVIAIDGLGAGKSATPDDLMHYQQEAMTQHILALMDSFNAEQFHLVGHDWGAALALGIAQRNPERVLSVTGVSAPPQNILLELLRNNKEQQEKYGYVGTLKGANPLLLKLFRAGDKIYQGAYAPLVEKGLITPEEGRLFKQATAGVKRVNTHINWYRANLPEIDEINDENFWPQKSPSFNMPTLLVWGNDDKTFAKIYLDIAANSGPDVEVVSFDGVGHWPHVERADQVNIAVRNTIEKADD